MVLVVSGTVVVILLLLLFFIERHGGHSRDKEYPAPGVTSKSTRCPLCGSNLTGNKRVKSVLFPGKPDSMMEINGCPYCFPVNPEILRVCPVCKGKVPVDGHVIARVFKKPGKTHVHVLGCTGCYKRKM